MDNLARIKKEDILPLLLHGSWSLAASSSVAGWLVVLVLFGLSVLGHWHTLVGFFFDYRFMLATSVVEISTICVLVEFVLDAMLLLFWK